MKPRCCLAIAAGMAAGMAIAVSSALALQTAGPDQQIASMAWLAGTWEGPMWGGTFTAYYCTPEGGKIMSFNRLMKDGQVGFHEFEVFEVQDGRVMFLPYPGGKPATPMPMTQCDAQGRKATFEKPDKDFPTRIEYHRKSENNLVITLSDPHGGSSKVQTFDLKRSS